MHALAEILFPALLNRSQVAQLWGVSVNTVSRYVRNGTMPAPLPGSRRWSKAEVLRARDRLNNPDSGTADAKITPLEEWRRSRGRG